MGARFQCLGDRGTSEEAKADVDCPDGSKAINGRDGSRRRPHDGSKANNKAAKFHDIDLDL